MTIEVRVPQLPESVADATLVAWHKKPGDAVARDENLVDLETDKVVLEVPAPAAGVLKEIRITDGTTVTSGQILALLEEGATRRRLPPDALAPAARPPHRQLSATSTAARRRPGCGCGGRQVESCRQAGRRGEPSRSQHRAGVGPRWPRLEVRRRQLPAEEGCAGRAAARPRPLAPGPLCAARAPSSAYR